MEVLKQLLGRLHPIIVHLPIGILLAALLLQWIDRKNNSWVPVITRLFLWAGISAILACLTGYLQYTGEGYAYNTVKTHLWFGIITTAFAFLMYVRIHPSFDFKWFKNLPTILISFLALLLISYTGHLGGSITHGEDYLVEPLPNNIKVALGYEVFEKREIVINEENWQETQLYDELIEPILNNNCVSCHNKKRAKGGLLLNSKEGILKGGENGEVLLAGLPDESPLYSRLILPEHHEDHMPPKDKPQPTKEEITLIKTWILADNPFNSTLEDLGLAKDLVSVFFPKNPNDDFPDVEIEKAAQDSINKIKNQGIHVQPLSQNSNFLSVSCINYPDFNNLDFISLLAIGKQIAVLDLGGTQISDELFEQIRELEHLTKLKIDHTKITGNGIEQLANLNYLKVLNLTGTRFKKDNLPALSQLHSLKTVYLFNTGLNEVDHREFKADSSLVIEFGNYELPKQASDSIIY